MPGTVLLTEKMIRDSQEMREFYRNLGISLETTELAVARRFAPRRFRRPAQPRKSRSAI